MCHTAVLDGSSLLRHRPFLKAWFLRMYLVDSECVDLGHIRLLTCSLVSLVVTLPDRNLVNTCRSWW